MQAYERQDPGVVRQTYARRQLRASLRAFLVLNRGLSRSCALQRVSSGLHLWNHRAVPTLAPMRRSGDRDTG